MKMEVEIEPMDSNFIELKILRSPDSEEFTRITFYRNRGYRNTPSLGPSQQIRQHHKS